MVGDGDDGERGRMGIETKYPSPCSSLHRTHNPSSCTVLRHGPWQQQSWCSCSIHMRNQRRILGIKWNELLPMTRYSSIYRTTRYQRHRKTEKNPSGCLAKFLDCHSPYIAALRKPVQQGTVTSRTGLAYSGRPRITWVHQICSDTELSAPDANLLAVCHKTVIHGCRNGL